MDIFCVLLILHCMRVLVLIYRGGGGGGECIGPKISQYNIKPFPHSCRLHHYSITEDIKELG